MYYNIGRYIYYGIHVHWPNVQTCALNVPTIKWLPDPFSRYAYRLNCEQSANIIIESYSPSRLQKRTIKKSSIFLCSKASAITTKTQWSVLYYFIIYIVKIARPGHGFRHGSCTKIINNNNHCILLLSRQVRSDFSQCKIKTEYINISLCSPRLVVTRVSCSLKHNIIIMKPVNVTVANKIKRNAFCTAAAITRIISYNIIPIPTPWCRELFEI